MRQMRTPYMIAPITLKRSEVASALEDLGRFLNEFESVYHNAEINVANLTEEEIKHLPDVQVGEPFDYSFFYRLKELDELVEKLEKVSESQD